MSLLRRFPIRVAVLIVIVLGGTLLLEVGGETAAAASEATAVQTLSFDDQRTDGHYVTVSEIVFPHGGWLDVRASDGDVLWTNRGNDELPFFEANVTYGGNTYFEHPLDRNQTVTAVMINDTNGNRVYDDGVDEALARQTAAITVQLRTDFETGAEGWTFVESTHPDVSASLREPTDPEHHTVGGVDGGFVVASDDLNGVYWDSDGHGIREWLAPEAYLGDRSNFYGGTLSFAARGTVDWPNCTVDTRYEDRPTLAYDVTLYSGEDELRYRFANPAYEDVGFRSEYRSAAPATEWETFVVPLSAPANATERMHGTANGYWDFTTVRDGRRGSYPDELVPETFHSILSTVERIEIRAESVSSLRGTDCEAAANVDEGHLDRVVVNVGRSTTEPVETPTVTPEPTPEETPTSTPTETTEPTTTVPAESDTDETTTDGESPVTETTTETSAGETTQSDDSTPVTTADGPGFTWLLAVVSLLVVCVWKGQDRSR